LFTDFEFVVWDVEFVADFFADGFEVSEAKHGCSWESDKAHIAIKPKIMLETGDFKTVRGIEEGDMFGD
jgi:hypothetical protein